ncbi:ROK family transcriptional regulator [uncultured Nocardioides sp.]|uniref:ROK family transcriptional regulator n=1 Tax=uncultured Nocardioides sp. TaxID=198441 RepID=UPI00262AFBF8|nr:ROK family transcriptional regulator [uncultured Nocardioides sp.]
MSLTSDLVGRTSRAGETLALIRNGSATTIAELAAAMGLARSTVSERVDLLVGRGLVSAELAPAQGRGRPASVFRFDPTARVALVAQVGMSGMRVGVTDLAGGILHTVTADVAVGEGPRALVDHVQRLFDDSLLATGRTRDDVAGVGVGLPGRIELESAPGGTTAPAAWSPYGVRALLAETWDVPICVDRAVSLLASAEQRSFHPGASVLLGLKVGTVVECGVVVDGRSVGGGSGIAGEIGHTAVAGADAPCVCGNAGCLNAVASGGALARDLAAAGHEVASARQVAALAAGGDVEAIHAVREAGRRIGEVLAGAVNLLNPDVVVVWGYLADGGDHLVAGLREGLYRAAVPAASRHVRLEAARYGDDAALKGAATAVVELALDPAHVDVVLGG